MAENRLMTHLVAGYPSMEESEEAAMAMVRGGASYLEIQFPFSDPIADGPLIQGACTESIVNGFTIDSGFAFLRRLSEKVSIPLFLMTYANLVVAAGLESFVQRSVQAGVSGLIIPDLPFDYDEGLYETGRKMGIPVIPVVVPGISPDRLNRILKLNPPYIYTAIRKGITGEKSNIDNETVQFLSTLTRSGASVLAGFGIREKEQVDLLSPHVHSVVIGSALVAVIKRCAEKEIGCYESVREFVSSLC